MKRVLTQAVGHIVWLLDGRTAERDLNRRSSYEFRRWNHALMIGPHQRARQQGLDIDGILLVILASCAGAQMNTGSMTAFNRISYCVFLVFVFHFC